MFASHHFYRFVRCTFILPTHCQVHENQFETTFTFTCAMDHAGSCHFKIRLMRTVNNNTQAVLFKPLLIGIEGSKLSQENIYYYTTTTSLDCLIQAILWSYCWCPILTKPLSVETRIHQIRNINCSSLLSFAWFYALQYLPSWLIA